MKTSQIKSISHLATISVHRLLADGPRVACRMSAVAFECRAAWSICRGIHLREYHHSMPARRHEPCDHLACWPDFQWELKDNLEKMTLNKVISEKYRSKLRVVKIVSNLYAKQTFCTGNFAFIFAVGCMLREWNSHLFDDVHRNRKFANEKNKQFLIFSKWSGFLDWSLRINRDSHSSLS